MRKSPIFAAIAGAIALVMTGLVSPSQYATAAATTQTISGANLTALADAARVATHPNSASKGVVAPAADPIAIVQAANLALGESATLIVSTSTTDPAAVNAIVSQKNITGLTFVGGSSAFPATYRNAIDPRVTSKRIALTNDLFERSKLLVNTTSTNFLIVDASDPGAASAALAYAFASDYSLMMINSAVPTDAVKNFVATKTDPSVIVVGNAQIVDELRTDDADKFGHLGLNSELAVDQMFLSVTQQLVDRKGYAATKIVTAPVDNIGAFAVAAMVAKARSATIIPAGPASNPTSNSAADRYIKLLLAEARSVVFVGVNATSTQTTAIAAPSNTARAAAPAWTITNTTIGTSNYTVSYTSGRARRATTQ